MFDSGPVDRGRSGGAAGFVLESFNRFSFGARIDGLGLDDLESVIRQIPDPGFDLRRYYTQHISYHLDEAKLQGMRRFLSLLPGRD